MAAGNLSPRQKMINLMYLVFIAMLALNMSKEVLSAFGLLNEKLTNFNNKATERNAAAFADLKLKSTEQPEKYEALFGEVEKIKQTSGSFNSYLDSLKSQMVANIAPEDRSDYEVMDKSDFLDQAFFQGDRYSAEGQKFVNYIDNFRTSTIETINKIPDSLMKPSQKASLVGSIETRFFTGDENGKVENRDGRPVEWLNYHYEGFPLVASLTKVTLLQSDIKTTQDEILKAMLQGQMTSDLSMTNYTTLLEQPKSAYYQGEKFDGSIVLGRKDATTRPNEVKLKLDGRDLKENEDYVIEDGRVKLTVNAGSAGDHTIEGNLIFKQEGEEIEVPVSQKFATITKPNAAVISADKMNVVYRGVSNPITISIPGIPDNKVSASASGLKKVSGSKYAMNPGTGRTVTISASGTLPDGQRVSSSSEFRIKDIPRPSGTVRGEYGEIKMPRNNLEISTVGAMLEDFDFDLNLAISGFKFKVPGQPTVQVRGNKLDGRAKSALKRAGRGEAVQIFDIEAYITNNRSYKLKKVSPVVVELTN
ncbi:MULTISPECIES: gliding motility protein GldM [Galbibacter]|uniref:Gliding motility protein GldM n=1 Tax=Galbibacter pacificus TaxID=2996052 RepID=A0ABT6FW30_9FLAO|nr:gliding motility protein GldM [Galbibacter pacificus]MDG3584094.1 gliding motility protein GldM [Galbibacter pacificus]MDG3587473.1 gliding motility protein GldM [Galbibacter pacificus]